MNFNNVLDRLRQEPEWAVLIGLLVLLIAAGGTFYYYRYQQRAQSSKRSFHRAMTLYTRSARSGNYDRTLTAMRQYVQNYPESYRTDKVHFFLGKIRLQQNQYIDAIRQFKTLLSKFPNSLFAESARLHIGYANVERGDLKVALRNFNRLASQSSSHPLATEALWQKAIVLWQQGKNKQASETLARVTSSTEDTYWTNWAGRLKSRIDAGF